jgi:hypothetical protein
MKRHLLKAGGSNPNDSRTACGLRGAPQTTNNPAQVTCLACTKTLFMADAEFRQTNPRRRRRGDKQ